VILTGLLLAFLALPLLPPGYGERLATVTDVESDPTGSAQARTRDLAVATSYVFDHPLLGAGAGMNMLALNDLRGSTWREVHSVYLQYAVDLGLPGLALFLCLLGTSYAAARGAARRAAATPGGAGLSALAEGIEVSLVGFAVAAFFHPVAYQFYFFYVAGLAAAARALSPAPMADPA
jgi:putative inorganic carbon (HCO3(-)) transporter